MHNFSNLKNEDLIIVFNGNIYPIKFNDNSLKNIGFIMRMISIICNSLIEYRTIFFDNDKIKKNLLDDDAEGLFDSIYNLKDSHKLLFCTVGEHNGQPSLYIDGDFALKVLKSKDFKSLANNDEISYFKYVIINSVPYDLSRFIIKENRSINEVESSDISLSSFKTKMKLNPKFWVNNKINSRVRLRLLDIADDFIKELSVDWVKPKDIVFTGSLANYNWSRYSDVDIHIVYDFKKIYKNDEFVDDYFKSKKENWNSQHDKLMIYGYPIEISVEDSGNESVSSGVYSLNKNKWIKEPEDFDDVKLNEKFIKRKASDIMTEIDNIEKKLDKTEDLHKIETFGNKLKSIFNRVKKARRESLERSGEMSSMNIVYKLLRRTKYLDKLWDMVNVTYNKVNSLK